MRQFLLPPSYAGERRLAFSGADFHHLVRVLRLREGDQLPAVDAGGTLHTMRIARVGRSACDVEIAPASTRAAGVPGASITLLQCLPKGRKIDLIVRQATEAGVSRVVLVASERSLSGAEEGAGRISRLRRIAREALQQSGSPRLPEIEGPRTLASLAEEAVGGQGGWGAALFFHEEKLSATSLHELLAGAPPTVSVLIGPEGGLSGREVALLAGTGWRPVFLGSTVLRVETAALYALGAVETILQEREAWRVARRK